MWAALADLGLFGLRVPEADGGLGLGWVETVAAYEVLGAHLVPGPLVWSQLLAGVVPGVADGSRIVTGVDHVDVGAPLIVEHLGFADTVAVVDADDVVLVDLTAVVADPAAAPDDASRRSTRSRRSAASPVRSTASGCSTPEPSTGCAPRARC